jgi:hypothetical protein
MQLHRDHYSLIIHYILFELGSWYPHLSATCQVRIQYMVVRTIVFVSKVSKSWLRDPCISTRIILSGPLYLYPNNGVRTLVSVSKSWCQDLCISTRMIMSGSLYLNPKHGVRPPLSVIKSWHQDFCISIRNIVPRILDQYPYPKYSVAVARRASGPSVFGGENPVTFIITSFCQSLLSCYWYTYIYQRLKREETCISIQNTFLGNL